MGGALCGGMEHNGTTVIPFGVWVQGGAFAVAAESGVDLPGPVDKSSLWYL
eukprot:CAMPEP_0170457456 /NCGR_PEP_ID=MMETSP0123-20130129/4739_1 /TAXON_ID=182087 /ORGANISM="Favella ehrenbergii, Strain Fehren 1" /LENGTH=50 /DNA_ID=CAMNT_0010721249 /DNA_START=206 /DNA_END=358 /DNA_ORIENTATION=+